MVEAMLVDSDAEQLADALSGKIVVRITEEMLERSPRGRVAEVYVRLKAAGIPMRGVLFTPDIDRPLRGRLDVTSRLAQQRDIGCVSIHPSRGWLEYTWTED